MSNLLSFDGKYRSRSGHVMVKLFMIAFTDKKGVHVVYSPHLDLTGYGVTKEAANHSFEVAFKDFVDYTLNKKTLHEVLKKLGWKGKGKASRPKALVPDIVGIIGKKGYVREVFNNYPTSIYHQGVSLPAMA